MKKTILLIILLNISSIASFSQNWQWSRNLSSIDDVQVNAVAYNHFNDNFLVLVVFQGTVSLNGYNFTSRGNKDILIVDYDNSGNILWNKQIGGTGKEVPMDITVDNNGNILVTGSFSDEADFDGTILHSYSTYENVFMVKYLSNGNQVFAKRVAWGPALSRGTNLSINNSNNIFLNGFYNDTLFFETDTLIWNGVANNFIAEYDTSGVFLQIIYDLKGTSGSTRINSVSLSNDNGLLITGHFVDSLFFVNDTLLSLGNYDMVLFKLNSSNKIEWIRHIGSVGNDRLKCSVYDLYGNIYSIGYIGGNTYIDSSGTDLFDAKPISPLGGLDIFIAKYNSSGRLLWTKTIGDTGDDEGIGIISKENLLHIGGFFSGTIIFNNDTLSSSDISNPDVFFGVLDNKGNLINAASMQGDDYDRCQGITYDGKGDEFLGGYFSSDSLTIGSETYANRGGKDGFIAKYSIPFKASITNQQNVTCNGGSNGSVTVTPYFGAYPYTYEWSYDDGSADSTLTNVPAGDYGVKVTDAYGKTDSVAFTITQPDSISVSAVITDVSCPNAGDGAIDITVKGGTPPYAYLWSTSNGSGLAQTQEDQSGLTAGDYTLQITDGHGCTKDTVIVVHQPDPITFGGSPRRHTGLYLLMDRSQ